MGPGALRGGGRRGLGDLLLDVALEQASGLRQLDLARLDEEGVEAAAVLDRAQRVGVTRRRTRRLRASDCSVTLQRFGRNRHLVFRFEWLTR